MFNYISSYFYPTTTEDKISEPVVIEVPETDSTLYSCVDVNSLLWDINNLSFNELQTKYRCSYITICNILKNKGYKVFTNKNIETDTTLIVIPKKFKKTNN